MPKKTLSVSKKLFKASHSYKASEAKAKKYIKDPEKLAELLKDTKEKLNKVPKGVFGDLWKYLSAMFRMIKAYTDGSYRDVPTGSLIMIVAAVIYFVLPIDVIPDFIPVIGYLDDALIVGWTVKVVKADLDDFIAWERN